MDRNERAEHPQAEPSAARHEPAEPNSYSVPQEDPPTVMALEAQRTRIRTMPETTTVTEAKARLSELVAAVANTQDHIDITRNGEPAAVLMSYTELAALRETIAILSDPAAVADIQQAKADIAAGSTVAVEELRTAMLVRRPATA